MPLLRVDEEVELDEDTLAYWKRGVRCWEKVAEVTEPRSGVLFNWTLELVDGCLSLGLWWGERVEREADSKRRRLTEVKVTAHKTQTELLSYRALFNKARGEATEASSPDVAPGEEVKTVWEPTEEELEALLEDGVLRLRVQLDWVDREPRSAPKDHAPAFLTELLFAEELSDLTVHVNGVPIPAHKIVLRQADYFRGLWNSGMVDAESGVGELKNETEEDVRGFLTFLYRGHLSAASPKEKSDLEERPLVYLRMGDFYGLETLKAAAEEVLVDQLEAANACEMAEVAEKWSLAGLTEVIRALATTMAIPKADLADLEERNLPAYHVCRLSQRPTRHRSTQTYDE